MNERKPKYITFEYAAPFHPIVALTDFKAKVPQINSTTSCENRIYCAGKSSPFPEIDKFIFDLICNCNGYIRKWSMPNKSDLLEYDLAGGYKFCENIGRNHKSNNVRITVDINSGQYFQSCHDPDCQGFTSKKYPLPHNVMPWLFLDDIWENNFAVETKMPKERTECSPSHQPLSYNAEENYTLNGNENLSCETHCNTNDNLGRRTTFVEKDEFDEFIAKYWI